MPPFVLLDAGRAARVDAAIDAEAVRIDAAAIEAALGWHLEPKGLCRGDVCIPTAGAEQGSLELEALAAALRRPVAIDVEAGAAYLGRPAAAGISAGRAAPDFTLPDAAGRPVTLSEHKGSKVLLAAWASW